MKSLPKQPARAGHIPVVGYALRFIRDDANYGWRVGEYVTARGKGTADLTKAHIYKAFDRAYVYGYRPLNVEIVEVSEKNGTLFVSNLVESRKAGITRGGDIYFDHLGKPRPGLVREVLIVVDSVTDMAQCRVPILTQGTIHQAPLTVMPAGVKGGDSLKGDVTIGAAGKMQFSQLYKIA